MAAFEKNLRFFAAYCCSCCYVVVDIHLCFLWSDSQEYERPLVGRAVAAILRQTLDQLLLVLVFFSATSFQVLSTLQPVRRYSRARYGCDLSLLNNNKEN